MKYKIWAIDNEGNLIVKIITSPSKEALLSRIERDNLIPVKLKPVRFSFFEPKVKRKEIIEFCNNISLMVGGGISLLEALDEFSLNTKNRRFKLITEEVIFDIRNGMSFSDALKKHKTFPDVVVHLVKIGEETGALSSVLKDAAEHLQKVDDIIANTKRALMYPLFVSASMFGAALFWLFYVLPKLTAVFSTMGIELPLPTVLLIKTVAFLNHYYWVFPAFFGLIAAVIIGLKINEKGKFLLDKIIYKLPIFGTLILTSNLAFFFEYEALLLRVGVSITNSLDIIKTTFKNLVFRFALENTNTSIKNGLGLSESFRKNKIFEPFVIRMISAGERTGEIDKQMSYIANSYYTKVNRMVEIIEKTMEPIVLTIAGVFFFIIVLALIVPVYQLVSRMGAVR
ncbi:MAG TPA: type II secretion system F family protein [Desulfurella acetivorans]|uniref:Type II secretion system F family protein n=1 Tax=Desulfurella acetivorans TaxID=33002 RepID=A0A7C6E7T4_DESAE|nr:type II secretion system F family protein [Desulfurella acetivorans]